MKFAALVVALCACSKTPPAPEPRLITDEEIAAKEAALKARITAPINCKRPVLRGTATPGEADLYPLIAGTDECSKEVAAIGKGDLREAVKAGAPDALAWDAKCGVQLATQVSTLVAYEGACSPLQLGGSHPDEEKAMMGQLRIAHLLGQRARIVGKTDVTAALWMLLDGIRVFQDLERGRTSLIHAMVSGAGKGILLVHAREMLSSGQPVLTDLPALIAAVDNLIATEPPMASILKFEGDTMAVTINKPGSPQGTGAHLANPKEEAALMYYLAEANAADHAKACPPTASFLACKTGLVALAKPAPELDGKDKVIGDLMRSLREAKNVEESRVLIRDKIVEILRQMMPSAFAEYPEKRAEILVRLASLRMHLEVLARAQCPTAAELDAPPWRTMREPALLGDAVRATIEGASIKLESPTWFTRKNEAWTIPCPAPRK